MSHVDSNSYETKLDQRYKLTTLFGVANLLRDIHTLRSQRFQGTDTTYLSCTLIDFERLLISANLTARQREALFLVYESGFSQNETAIIMGITQQAVSKHLDNAIAKIVIRAKEEENKNV